ncbi:MAG TPA: polyphosphate polymerase domain-containing protein [Bacteroidetes bacterium]|nr:polyphosphate polymerase domain-containing protein [Bacteroidota bacterium]HEX05253.1 polyphosphate polymerase domain-containing protein [Bacteroidota bacterium]
MERFERKEFKFYVPVERASELCERVKTHMLHDPFCAELEHERYVVRSIYLDTPSLQFYFEKVDGLRLRKKLRVRVYNELEEGSPAFFEIKRKIEDTIVKERARLDIEESIDLLNGSKLHLRNGDGNESLDSVVINRFTYLINRLHLEPKALITYEREAFYDPDNPDLRITFDYNVRSYLNPSLQDFYKEDDLRTVSNPNFILEVKFSIALPLWTRQMLKDFRLHLQSISKYCNGVDCWDDVEKLTDLA